MTPPPQVETRSLAEAGPDPQGLIDEAAGALRAGALVVLPTETVYGLVCRADDEAAQARLRAFKGEARGADKPFARLVPSLSAVAREGARLPRAARRLAARYWPGPLTLVLADAAGGSTTGYRVPGHEFARRVLERAQVPLVATSVNRAGEPPAETFDEALAAAQGDVDLAIDGGPALLRAPSTVVRVVGDEVPEVLREGFLDRANIERALERLFVFVCTGNTCRSPMAEAMFRQRLGERLGRSPAELEAAGWRVASAGIAAGFGGPAAEHALDIMGERGLDLSGHRSRPLDHDLVADAELIVGLTPDHTAALRARWPEADAKLAVLDPLGVPDPVGRDRPTYIACAEHIAGRLDVLLDTLDLEDGREDDAGAPAEDEG